jgi:hypothetical protein
MRAEIRMKRGHSFWATYRETSEVIYLQGLFDDYWGSNSHEFTVLSQSLSPTRSQISDREGQKLLSLESIEVLWNYDSLQVLLFVLGYYPLPLANNVRPGRSFTVVPP